MKETYYFPHDSNATQDPKMMILLAECGLAGVGMYWILIEILHQQDDGRISEEAYKQYIKFYYSLRGQGENEMDKIQQVLNTSGLLLNKGGFVYSERVIKNKEYRQDISSKRSMAGRRSAEARANSTNVEQNPTSAQQGKEIKGNERKGKERKSYNSGQPEFTIAQKLMKKIVENNPSHLFAKMSDAELLEKTHDWALHVDYMIRIDKRDPGQIGVLVDWCQQNTFWKANILSTAKHREQFDKLVAAWKREVEENQKYKIAKIS